jgi:hypothetical protein
MPRNRDYTKLRVGLAIATVMGVGGTYAGIAAADADPAMEAATSAAPVALHAVQSAPAPTATPAPSSPVASGQGSLSAPAPTPTPGPTATPTPAPRQTTTVRPRTRTRAS